MAMSFIALVLILAAGIVGFLIGFAVGERKGRRSIQHGFAVLPASKDLQ